MDPMHLDTIDALFDDDAFQGILKTVTVATVTWNEFLDMAMPHGITANRAWRLIHEINLHAGVRFFDILPEKDVFYRYSLQIIEALTEFSQLYLKTSNLENLSEVKSSDQMGWACARDGVAAARMGGIAVDESEVLDAWDPVGKRIVKDVPGPGEQLVLNTLEIASKTSELALAPITGATIMDVASAIENGVARQDERVLARTPLTPVALDPIMSPPPGISKPDKHAIATRAGLVARYIEGNISDPSDMRTLRMLSIPDLICTYLPFGCISSLVGKVVQKIALYRAEMPLLSWFPLNIKRLAWETGNLAEAMPYSKEDILETQRHEQALGLYDVTAFQTVNLKLAISALEESCDFIARREARYRRMKQALAASPYFNQRQRAILARAAKGTDRTFTIRYHQNNNSISYATARRDIQELFDAGYLTSSFTGNTQVFCASPRLKERLDQVLGIAPEEPDKTPPFFARPAKPDSATAVRAKPTFNRFPSH